MSAGAPGEIIDWLVELLEANGAEITNLVLGNGKGSEIEFFRDGRNYSLFISERGPEQENGRD